MTHDPIHAIYLGTGVLYFGGAFYFAFKNYQITRHDGFWFFLVLFCASMTGALISGTLWSADVVKNIGVHAYYDIFFLMASLFLFVATYTLHKEHHKVRVF